MKRISQAIKEKGVLVSDGAWGTFLYEKGLKVGECPELWSVERFDDVVDIAKSYIDAGADMVETNSFGANEFKLEHFGLQDRVEEINKAAVLASAKAAGDKIVLGSVGSTGKMLLMGDVTKDEMKSAYKRQIQALLDGGADAIVVETMTDIEEAEIAVAVARELTDADIVATFTFDKTKQGEFRTMMGITPTQAAQAMIAAGADVVGANCGSGMEQMAEVVKEIREACPDAYILIHANAGLPQNIDGKDVYLESPEQMAEFTKKAILAGANIVGGCCGTTPKHICAIRKVADDINR